MTPPRILIADPDLALLTSYRAALSRQGFAVATAPDGLQCVGLLRAFAPDLVVLSPGLPWGGGDGVLAVMTEESRVGIAPVIVLSTGQDLGHSPRLWDFPIAEYHSHPVSPELLARRIRLLLARGEMAQAAS